jgi:hypothetical protein
MAHENQELKSEAQVLADTAVKIDRIIQQAKELTGKLRETCDSLNIIAGDKGGN